MRLRRIREVEDASNYQPASTFPTAAMQEQGRTAARLVTMKASEVTGKLGEKLEERRGQAAEGIELAARRLHQRAESHEGIAGQATEKLAEGMDRTATYLRKRETRGMAGGAVQFLRQHPVATLLGAIAAGFVILRIIR